MTGAAPRLVAVAPATAAQWREIAAGCDYATWFHTWEWAELWRAETGGKLEPHALLFTFDDGRTALVPMARRTLLGGLLRHYVSSATGKYGGWISAGALDAAAVAAVWAHLEGLPLTLRRNPFAPQDAVVPWSRPDFTQALDLTRGFAAVLDGWSSNHRTSLARAEKKGVTVVAARGPEDWRAYYRLYEESLKRWGERAQTQHRWSVFDRLAALPTPGVRLWLALHEGAPVSGAVCFYHRRHAVYWHGATSSGAFTVRPAHKLFHDVIGDACAGGYRWFDFNPSGGLDGVVQFKDGFGAARLPADVHEHGGLALRALRRAAGWVRR